MKLCRFELRREPGTVRSGIVHGAKVYETDGSQPIAVHEAEDIRPLPPVGTPGSIRLFRFPVGEAFTAGDALPYGYLNPGAIIGPSKIIPFPPISGHVDVEPYLCAILANPGSNIPIELADEMILGYTLMNAVVLRDATRAETRVASGPGRSMDTALILGPVLITIDELQDTISSDNSGQIYSLDAVVRVNGVELRRGNTSDLPVSFAEAISYASESCQLRAGDLFAMGPIAHPLDLEDIRLSPDSEVQLAVEKIGTLTFKLTI